MRKMDYCRYDSPVSSGTIGTDSNRDKFYLDHPVENGIYMVVITDPADGDTYTMHLTVKDHVYAYANFISTLRDSRASIHLDPDQRNIIYIDMDYVEQGSTIELYKLN